MDTESEEKYVSKGESERMNPWSQELYVHAWNFASRIHHGQTMPGSQLPYLTHLGMVAMEVMTAIASEPAVEFPDLAVQCAVLHDTLEDTQTTHAELQEEFTEQVADGVLALSKDLTLPTKSQQMEGSLSRICQQPKAVWMVKLADRISNLHVPPSYWTHEKIASYRNEAVTILHALGAANMMLSVRLSEKIDAYALYADHHICHAKARQ